MQYDEREISYCRGLVDGITNKPASLGELPDYWGGYQDGYGQRMVLGEAYAEIPKSALTVLADESIT
jgi:hypothetical protein